MKELSIEQKAQRYDEALKAAIVASKDEDRHLKATLERIFPELKESEDERIRMSLIDMLKNDEKCYLKEIAWLEKQGEQKPVIEMKSPEESLGIDSDTYNKIVDECIYGEQKLAWSEEDETMFINLVAFLEGNGGTPAGGTKAFSEWLKERYRYALPMPHWKPSDEQIKALHDLNLTGNISYAGQGQVLIELYNDLKKLREEDV